METKQTSLAILIFLLVSSVILSCVWYIYFNYYQQDDALCGDQLKRCPDGSFVSLGGPLCGYPMCPKVKPAAKNQAFESGQPARIEPTGANEAVNSFYSWYQGLSSTQKRKQLFETRTDLTDNFKTRLGQTDGGFDSAACLTGKLGGFEVGPIFASGQRSLVSILLNETSASRPAMVELIENGGLWQINEIFCQSPSAGLPEDIGSDGPVEPVDVE